MKPFNLKSLFLLLAITIAAFYTGCDDSGIVDDKTATDSTLINYDNLIISERTIPFDSAYSSVDLLKGEILMELSTLKDAVLVDYMDTLQSLQMFYFRSGDKTIDAAGFETRFKQYVYPNLTQSSFDTLTVIPDSDTTLNEQDFETDGTPTFNDPLQNHSVYGFYLKGKSTVNIKPIYGMLYLDSAWRDNNNYFKLRFDVKLNTGGENSFKVPTQQ
ncbi:MAG: hypothetical protein EHM58_00025 [Ignavibacteriae bacterium]|nr:MAG: hypothetical protein EHM58_00025 [Ignavibacteriota bacterium]